MNKVRKVLAIVFLVVSSAWVMLAQDNGTLSQCDPLYECMYKYTIDGEIQETYSTVLQIGMVFTRFYDYTAYAVDSLSFVKDASVEEKNRLDEMRRTSMFYFGKISRQAPCL